MTLVGTLIVALSPLMRQQRPHPSDVPAKGLGPLRAAGFPALLCCVGGLGIGFGVSNVTIPAFAAAHTDGDSQSLAGILLGIFAVGSAISGVWFGTRRPAHNAARQMAWLLGAVAASYLVFMVMPNPVALGVALVAGGSAVAPALTVQNTMVGRIAPASMLNEAYTWVVTVIVAATAAGGAVAGLLIDNFGVPWAFLAGGTAVTIAAGVAAWPSGPIARAEAGAAVRLERELAPELV